MRAGGIVSFGAAPRVWRTWWLGDLSGALIIVPLALAWRHPPGRRHAPREWVEAALVLGAVLAVTEASFHTSRPLTYVVFPALIWSALRLGRRGATLSVAIASGLVLWNTTHYEGPFVFRSISESVLTTQLFIVVAATTTLALAVAVAEREEMAERLGASRNRLLTVADAERRRIERNLHDGAQQRLVSLGLQLRMAREHVTGPPEETATALASAESELETATDELRDLVRGLHPVVLRELSLASALQSLGAHSTIPVSFVELPDAELDPVVEETAYYLLAEALTDAQRHSRAVTVEVRVAVDDGTLRLEVRDDGIGGANEAAGSGLRGLRERVGGVGGVFSVESPPGGGTTVVALVPCR